MKDIQQEIKERKKKGFNRSEIISALLKMGYKKDVIKESLPNKTSLFYFWIIFCGVISISIFVIFISTRFNKIFSVVGLLLMFATYLLANDKKWGKYIWNASIILLTIGFIVASLKSGFSFFSLIIILFPIIFIYGLNRATKKIDDEFILENPKSDSDIKKEISNNLKSSKCPACLNPISENDIECSDCGLALN